MALHKPDTLIYLESGQPAETTRAIEHMGFLNGQLTSPPLIEEAARAMLSNERAKSMDAEQFVSFCHEVLGQISVLVPQGKVFFDLYADAGTSADEMMRQVRAMYNWIPDRKSTRLNSSHYS